MDSNHRPLRPERSVLPAELHPEKVPRHKARDDSSGCHTTRRPAHSNERTDEARRSGIEPDSQPDLESSSVPQTSTQDVPPRGFEPLPSTFAKLCPCPRNGGVSEHVAGVA